MDKNYFFIRKIVCKALFFFIIFKKNIKFFGFRGHNASWHETCYIISVTGTSLAPSYKETVKLPTYSNYNSKEVRYERISTF